MLSDSISKLKDAFLAELKEAQTLSAIEQLRIQYLGKQGHLTSILKQLSKVSAAEKKSLGQLANQTKQHIAKALQHKHEQLQEELLAEQLAKEHIDITLPGRRQQQGRLHPVTLTENRAVKLLEKLGFSMVKGLEIEDEYHNFEALNMPKDHPARDMQDTFYFADGKLLRTHTSSVQIRLMENSSPPLRIVTPGRVYRRDSDQTHTPMFHQLEGLVVNETTNFLELQATLQSFLEAFFGQTLSLRVRPSYFPFTEPSAEIDIAFDPHTRKLAAEASDDVQWLEVLGCGMVHPNVLRAVNVDTEKFQGFAFGVGLDRLAMLRYGITDLRSMFEHDLDFLSQFSDLEGFL